MESYGQQIAAYLKDLVVKTREEKIAWTQANPTMYVATVASAHARITLQRASSPVRVMVNGAPQVQARVTFSFQLIDLTSNSIVLNSTEAAATPNGMVLSELYNAIGDLTKKSGAELLKRIVTNT